MIRNTSTPVVTNLLDDGQPDPDVSMIDFSVVDVSQIRSRSLPWTAYKTLVSDHTVQLMIQYDKQSPETQSRLLAKSGEEYAEAFVQLLEHLHHVEPLQYILTLISDMLAVDEKRAALFHGLVPRGVEPYVPFVRLLSMSNWYILKNAVDTISLLLSTSDYAPRSHHEVVTAWICRLFASPKLPEHAIGALLDASARVLRVHENRTVFAKNDGLGRLATLVSRFSSDVTQLYKVGLNLWLLSFNDEVALQFVDDGLLSVLCDVVRTSEKEKIQRVFLATLKNLVKLQQTELNEELIDLGLLKTVNALSYRSQSKDEDMVEDVKFLMEALQRDFKEYTTFEKYQKEVLSGRLDWTPSHTNEAFWRENINRFEVRDFELIRVLVGTLKSVDTPAKQLCICLNDLGEFARNHARGKGIVQEFGGKERVMELLLHSEPSVRKYALLCMQKMLVQKHQFLVK